MDLRELKALEIAARYKIEFQGGFWIVPSQSGPTKYKVVLGEKPHCPCDDFQLRNEPCKHVIAARLVCERDHDGKAPTMDTDAVPKKLTYKQNWPLYNLAQQTEKKRFMALLHDLCRDLADPPKTKPGRKQKPMSDIAFATIFKVFSTFSSRRFQCDLDDALAKGYLSESMHGVHIGAYLCSESLTPVLKALIVRSSLPLKAVETTFAPDSTGFSTSRFIKWFDVKYNAERSGHMWVKAHAICGVKTNIVTSAEIAGKDAGDSPMFKPLVEATAENFTIDRICADKAYLSHDNLALVDQLGGTAYVPFKSNSVAGEAGSLWERMFFYYQFRREEFLRHYHQRSNAESTFAMLKAKFRDHVRSKTDVAMRNEVLAKFVAHNVVVVHQSQIELGIEPTFWNDGETEPQRDVIPITRRG